MLRAALSFGMSGFPFYSHDVGGFSGLPSPRLYVRWAQFGLFSSHTRCHGAPPREPWEFGEEALNKFRKFAELRYRMLPYILSEAAQCARESLPMVRPIVLEFQGDPMTFKIDDQYLFGQSLLVAPIFDESDRRKVYLPLGDWTDFWTKAPVTGDRWLEIEASIDVLPMFIRQGAIIPYGPLMQHTGERAWDPLTIEIYRPLRTGRYFIHNEGRPAVPVQYEVDGLKLTVAVGQAPGQVDLVIYGPGVAQAELGSVALPCEQTENGGARVRFDGSTAQIVVFQLEGDFA